MISYFLTRALVVHTCVCLGIMLYQFQSMSEVCVLITQQVTIQFSGPSGAFSQFFVRFSGNLSVVSDVTDRDYQLAIIEANVRVEYTKST